MVPFKPYLPGIEPAPFPRATSVQKCLRTLDIDEVGKTTRHGTFFQMAGNFSFGDYFKEGAITLGLGAADRVPGRRRLRLRRRSGSGPTVYQDDDEAYDIWRRVIGVPDGADPAPRDGRQLLVDGRARPVRPVLGDLLRPRPRVRPRGRPDRRRGPLPRGLEPRLHAVRAGSGRRQGGLPDPRRAAEEEHRHRHGRGADGLPAAGRRQPLRDRRGLPGAGPGGRADRPGVRAGPGRGRPAAGDRRPRPLGADDHRRRGDARPTRAAATCCAGCCAGWSARSGCSATRTRRCPSCCRCPGTRWPRRTRRWPPTSSASPPTRTRRRRRSPRRCGPARRSWTPRSRRPSRPAARRCPGSRRSSCTTRTASRST